MRRVLVPYLSAILLAIACGRGPAGPAELDTKSASCSWCRMAVSDRRFAAQLVARAEEPLFFDDVGCLRDYLAARKEPMAGWTAFVSDHRTRAWIPAGAAVYARVTGLSTPMSSGLVAHADAASRSGDEGARGGTPLSPEEIFGKTLPRGQP